MPKYHNYFVYIVTNVNKTVLYTGVTNDLERRVYEHEIGAIKGFSQKYNCKYLIYYEYFVHRRGYCKGKANKEMAMRQERASDQY